MLRIKVLHIKHSCCHIHSNYHTVYSPTLYLILDDSNKVTQSALTKTGFLLVTATPRNVIP